MGPSFLTLANFTYFTSGLELYLTHNYIWVTCTGRSHFLRVIQLIMIDCFVYLFVFFFCSLETGINDLIHRHGNIGILREVTVKTRTKKSVCDQVSMKGKVISSFISFQAHFTGMFPQCNASKYQYKYYIIYYFQMYAIQQKYKLIVCILTQYN